MRRNLIAAIFALGTLALAATDEDYTSQAWKDEISRGYLPYRKLGFDDFPAFDNTTSRHTMYTQGFIHYNFDMRWKESGSGATATITTFTVRSGFDRNKSWKRSTAKNIPELMEHEQRHLDINELYAQNLKKLKDLPPTKGIDYQEAMEKMRQVVRARAAEILKESQAEQDRYDAETSNGRNYVKQAEWNDSIQRRLGEANVRYARQ